MAYYLIAPTGARIPLPVRSMRFGSAPEADVCLGAEMELAPVHFALQPSHDGVSMDLIPLAGDQPVLVNETPTKARRLTHGDRIQAGRLQVVFESGASEPEAAPPAVTPEEPEESTPPAPSLQSAFFKSEPLQSPTTRFGPAALPPRAFGFVKPLEESIEAQAAEESTPLPALGAMEDHVSMPASPVKSAVMQPKPVAVPAPMRPLESPGRQPKLSLKTAIVAGIIAATWLWAALETLRPAWEDRSGAAFAKVPCYLAGAAGIGFAMGWLVSLTYHKNESLKRRTAAGISALGAVITLVLLALPVGMASVPGATDGIAQLVENVQNLSMVTSPAFSWSAVVTQFLQPWAMLGLLASVAMAWRCADD
jgi:hypothetical protein